MLKESFRKRASYVMLPVMVLYLFSPNIVYGAQVIEGTASGAGESVAGERALDNARKIAEAINLRKGQLNAGSTPGASSSFASNMGGSEGVSVQVNEQTGQLDVSISCAKLSGISKDTDIELGLSNGGGSQSIYGLPPGWKYSIDYIDTQTGTLYAKGNSSFTIDSTYTSYYGPNNSQTYQSGLRYCTNKGMHFTAYPSNGGKVLPYDSNLTYYFILADLDGTNEYFDLNGKLICSDDRFGNNVRYNYTSTGMPFNAYNSQLASITDSYNQTIGIGYANGVITVTMPDNRTAKFDFSTLGSTPPHITLTGVTGLTTMLNLSGSLSTSPVSSVKYPGGGTAYYTYTNNALVYPIKGGTTGTFSGVTKVTMDPGNSNSSADSQIVTDYNYQGSPGRCYTGNGSAYVTQFGEDANGKPADSLMESNDNSYTYTTIETNERQPYNGGSVSTAKKFNFLHLPLQSVISQGTTPMQTMTYNYTGQTGSSFGQWNHLQTNYNQPNLVTSQIAGATNSHKMAMTYDDYGKPLTVNAYNNNALVSQETTAYDYTYGLPIMRSIYDATDSDTVTVANTLGGNKDYVAASVTNKSGETLGKELDMGIDTQGRPKSLTYSFAGETPEGNGANPVSTNKTISYSLSGNNLTVTHTDALGNTTNTITDISNGQAVSQTDALGNTVKYTYTNNGLTVTKTYADLSYETQDSSDPAKTVTTGSSGIVRTSYLDGLGRVIRETDNLGANGAERTLQTTVYNELGKPASETDIFGNSISYVYNDYKGRQTSATDYLTNVASTVYDDVNQQSVTSVNGIQSSMSKYDDLGKVIQTVSSLSGSAGMTSTPLQVSNYNGLNQVKSTVLELGNGSFDESGNGSGIMSGTFSYDIDGKMKSAAVNTADGTNVTNSRTLSLFGDIISANTAFSSVSPGVSGPGSYSSESTTCDAVGQFTQLANQNNQTISYTYDKNGNVHTMTDFAGNTFTYTYDKMNRMLTMTGPTYMVTNTYYPAGSGSLSSDGSYEGALQSRTLSPANNSATVLDKITYAYTPGGKIASVTYNDGKSMSVTYDQYDRVGTMTDYSGVVTTYTYDPTVQDNISKVSNTYGYVIYKYYTKSDNVLFGSQDTIKEADYSNGTTVAYSYYTDTGKAPKLKSITTTNSAGAVLGSIAYTYDAQDRIATMAQGSAIDTSVNSNNTKTLTYNDLDMVTGETVTDSSGKTLSTTSYTYDIKGNILSKTVASGTSAPATTSYTYNVIDQLKSVTDPAGNTQTFVYDLNGNLTNAPLNGSTPTLAYNELNQLTEYTDTSKGVDVTYQYTAESLRKSKTDKKAGNTLAYYYLPSGEVANESDGTNISSYLMAHDRILRAVNNTIEYYIKNGKDVVGTTDGTTQTNYQYTSYGQDVDLTSGNTLAPKGSFSINDNPFKYSGYYQDSESGLYYLQSRYYSPELMAFISRDTYEVTNKYAYCGGDPVAHEDPKGHMRVRKYIQNVLEGEFEIDDPIAFFLKINEDMLIKELERRPTYELLEGGAKELKGVRLTPRRLMVEIDKEFGLCINEIPQQKLPAKGPGDLCRLEGRGIDIKELKSSESLKIDFANKADRDSLEMAQKKVIAAAQNYKAHSNIIEARLVPPDLKGDDRNMLLQKRYAGVLRHNISQIVKGPGSQEWVEALAKRSKSITRSADQIREDILNLIQKPEDTDSAFQLLQSSGFLSNP